MDSRDELSARVLGQILLMQSVVAQLPDKVSMLRFACRGLKDVSGVTSVEYRVYDYEAPVSEAVSEVNGAGYTLIIQHKNVLYAELALTLSDMEAFSPYIPYIENFGNMLAVMFEEHRQRNLNDALMANLEQRVFERTKELELEIEERQRAEDALKRAQNYITNIINSMPSVLIGVDPAGIITQWNHEAEHETGLSATEAVGQPLQKAIPHLSDELTRIQTAIASKREHADTRRKRFENGEHKYEDVTIYPLIANGMEGAVIRVDDVTQRTRAEEVMIQTEKMMSVGGLAAGMAHEINNPLSGILQSAQNILRRASPELSRNFEVARACGTELEAILAYMEERGILRNLDMIRNLGERAADIVANMLKFSRSSNSGQMPINIADLLDSTVELASADYDLKKHYDFRHIRIEREYDPQLPDIVCAELEISQVVLNLLRNAAQAIADQAERADMPTITLRTYREGTMVCIDVQDNGPGMDEETCKHVFEPFFTTKEVGLGTGLGLSVSYFIITTNHRGTLTVQSSPGKGTAFSIRLPLEKGEGS